jgi:hypothetical protein
MPTEERVRSRPELKNSDSSVRDRYTEAPVTAAAAAATAAAVTHDDWNFLVVAEMPPGFGRRNWSRIINRPCLYV